MNLAPALPFLVGSALAIWRILARNRRRPPRIAPGLHEPEAMNCAWWTGIGPDGADPDPAAYCGVCGDSGPRPRPLLT